MAKFKKGEGGRKRGSKNKATVAKEHAAKTGANKNLTPLAHLLKIMRDPKQPKEVRMEMAKAAAPYMHSRLQSTTVRNPEDEKLVIQVVVSWRN